MKKEIHPEYYHDTNVVCACGNGFITGSTLKEIRTEICSKCHPFYTGKQKLVDTVQRIEKFRAKSIKKATLTHVKGKKAKKAARKVAKNGKTEETDKK